jgi:hypothetical protein
MDFFMFSQMLNESVRDYLRTETTQVQINTIIQFIEKTQFSDLKEDQVFVLSIRSNLPNNDELVLWNTDYNYEQERIKGEKGKKNKVISEVRRIKSANYDRGQAILKQGEKAIPLENRYEILSDMLVELNKKFNDSIDPEFCVERFVEFKPVGDVMKPSQFSFDEILLEHQMIIDNQSTLRGTKQSKEKKTHKTSKPMMENKKAEQLATESEINYKIKYELVQEKLKKFRDAVLPIVHKYGKINFDSLQKKKGFILSMIDVFEYLDSSHDSGDSCSEYGDYD